MVLTLGTIERYSTNNVRVFSRQNFVEKNSLLAHVLLLCLFDIFSLTKKKINVNVASYLSELSSQGTSGR